MIYYRFITLEFYQTRSISSFFFCCYLEWILIWGCLDLILLIIRLLIMFLKHYWSCFSVESFVSNCIHGMLMHITFEKDKKRKLDICSLGKFLYIISNLRIETGPYVPLYLCEEMMPPIWQTQNRWFGWEINYKVRKNMIIKCQNIIVLLEKVHQRVLSSRWPL